MEVEVTDDEAEAEQPSSTTINDAASVSSKRSKSSQLTKKSSRASTRQGNDDDDDEQKTPTPPPRRTKIVTQTRERIEVVAYTYTTLHVAERRIPEHRQDRPAVYFLRNLQTKLPTPLDAEQARATMPRYIEYGVLSQNSLIMLQQLMTNIYVPLLNSKSSLSTTPDDATAKPNMLRDEFMLNMNKFVQQIRRTINQIEGRFGLEIPTGTVSRFV